MHGFNDWALTLAVFIPLVGAVVMLVIPRAEEEAHKLVALVTTVADLVVGGFILARFKLHHTGLQPVHTTAVRSRCGRRHGSRGQGRFARGSRTSKVTASCRP